MKIFKIFSLFFLLPFLQMKATETFILEAGKFEKLKITSNMRVVYRNLPDSAGYARYEGEPNQKDIFLLSNKGKGTLRVQVAQTQWGRTDLPILYLYSDFLSEVESSSEQTVWIETLSPCADFKVTQIGNGEIIVDDINATNVTASLTTGNGIINVAGKCMNASFRMVGTGQIMADRLQAEDVKCSILGTGSIGCWPIENLSVKGLGTTKIYYKGHPNIKKSGGGKLFELPSDFQYSAKGVEVPSFNNPSGKENQEESTMDDDDDEEDGDDDDETLTIVTRDE